MCLHSNRGVHVNIEVFWDTQKFNIVGLGLAKAVTKRFTVTQRCAVTQQCTVTQRCAVTQRCTDTNGGAYILE